MRFSIHNRQRRVRIDLEALRRFCARALQECLRSNGGLHRLPEITVVLVSDRKISELHRRFMNVPGPTDVITFRHGEIFVSTETARRQARQFGTTTADEIKLYIAHGLLHLHGYDDKTSAAARAMARAQERIVRRAC